MKIFFVTIMIEHVMMIIYDNIHDLIKIHANDVHLQISSMMNSILIQTGIETIMGQQFPQIFKKIMSRIQIMIDIGQVILKKIIDLRIGTMTKNGLMLKQHQLSSMYHQ